MKSLSALLTLAALAATSALAQMSQPMVSENTTRIYDHVWANMGFPNIAIVVGSHATLVVDTGLGPKNGATAARVAARLAPNNLKLFLTTTHFRSGVSTHGNSRFSVARSGNVKRARLC
jgi:hypothetical protein